MGTTEKNAQTDKQQLQKQQGQGQEVQQGQQGQQQPTDMARRTAPRTGPIGLMRRLFEDLERLSGGRRQPSAGTQFGVELFMPNVEVLRRGDKLVVEVDLPGNAPDDVRVTIDNGLLMIEGERRSEHEDREGDVWTSERSYGRFQRAIELPENADPDSAEARFENGVLEITIKAPEPRTQGRQLEIKSGSKPADRQQSGSH
jgi:HSP20 family protein